MGCTATTIQKDEVNIKTPRSEDIGRISTPDTLDRDEASAAHREEQNPRETSCSSVPSFLTLSRSSRSSGRRRGSSWSNSSALPKKIDEEEKGQPEWEIVQKGNEQHATEIQIDLSGKEFEYDDSTNADSPGVRSPRVIRVAGTDHIAVVSVAGANTSFRGELSSGSSVEEEKFDCPTDQCGRRQVAVPSGFDWIPLECWIAPAEFAAVFEMESRLGQGSTCSVSFATKRACQDCAASQHAVKEVRRPKKTSSVRREVSILSRCVHPNIVRLDGVSMGPHCFYIVTELCTGGTVIDCLKGRDGLGEGEARRITVQLLDAVKYLHANGIVHRDIKPDNIVCEDWSRQRVVLIDFGSARELSAMKELTRDWAGTPAYMAPEMVTNRTRDDSKAVDMWALGVTVYVMLTGYLPFFGANVRALMKEVRQKRLVYPRGIHISRQSARFVGSLLRKRVCQRMTVDDALQHEWITGRSEE